MSDSIVDARGMLCPKPLIMTKKAFSPLSPGEQLTVLLDNDIAFANVSRFLTDNGAEVLHTKAENVYTLTATKRQQDLPGPDVAAYRGPVRPHVICVNSDRMGTGDDDLGRLLIKGFISAIKEVEPLPATIVFYNSGILLTTNDAPTAEPLRELAKLGIRILVCGTCVNFFGKQDEIAVGTISNLYDILSTLTDAGHVVVP